MGIGLALLISSPVSAKRQAALLNFEPPIGLEEVSANVVHNGLLTAFESAQPTGSGAPSQLAPGRTFLRVPSWMRGEPDLAFNRVGLTTNRQDCGPAIYSPSAMLNVQAEKRRQAIFPIVHRIACESGLPVGLMDALIIQESGYNHAAVSKKGAFGLGQLMPDTARQLGVNRFDLRDNLRGAAAYLKQQLDTFGQVHLALAAYNAGPGRVRKKREIPNIEETQTYVRRILSNWRHLTGNASDSVARPFKTKADIVRVY